MEIESRKEDSRILVCRWCGGWRGRGAVEERKLAANLREQALILRGESRAALTNWQGEREGKGGREDRAVSLQLRHRKKYIAAMAMIYRKSQAVSMYYSRSACVCVLLASDVLRNHTCDTSDKYSFYFSVIGIE